MEDSLEIIIDRLARQARQASFSLVSLSTSQKNAALLRIAELLEEERAFLQGENRKDILQGREKGMSAAMLNRLELTDTVMAAMSAGVREVCSLKDPVGEIQDMAKRPNGLLVGRMRVPLGVIAMIYESRPNVTIDAAVLCLKSGNAVILRGGSEAFHSNMALARILQRAFAETGIDPNAAQVVPVTDRAAVNILLSKEQSIDLVIPRGGEGLIRFVVENSRIPVLKHYKGVCHIYVDRDADLEKATPIIINSKVQRPGVCNAVEGLLLHKAIAEAYLPVIANILHGQGVDLRGCPRCIQILPEMNPAQESDWGAEHLDLILSVRVVDGIEEAREYIRQFGSQHTETIITENYSTAQEFITSIDASAVMVNASTRFNDGGQLGLGAEIGISTTKLHAYGPMGLEELTTRKFVVFGQGQVRG
jgi:glutamate-5-semialdehyde dehydrogenase